MSEFGENDSVYGNESNLNNEFSDRKEEAIFNDPHTSEKENESELIDIYTELQNNPDTEYLASLYVEILEQTDRCVEVVADALSELKNTQLIPAVAQSNMRSQANEYLKAASHIAKGESATILVFGSYTTIHSLEELEKRMGYMYEQFKKVGSETLSFDIFVNEYLPILDKYLFSEEYEEEEHPSVRVIQHVDSDESRFDFLKEGNFLDSDSIKMSYSMSLLGKEGDLSDIVVVDVPHSHALELDRDQYWNLLREYWVDIPQDERPVVVISYNDLVPMDLYDKVAFTGFLFSEGGDDNLRNTIKLAQRLVNIKKGVKSWDQPTLISVKESDYDKSEDLREWEHITADTYQSLKAFLTRANNRNLEYEETIKRLKEDGIIDDKLSGSKSLIFEPGMVPTPPRTILDLGTGEGRIGGMLARAGYNVLGIDLSQEMLNRGEERLRDEGAGLRGERPSPDLSYPALQKLGGEGIVKGGIITDDGEARRKYIAARGDFLSLYPTIENLIQNWEELYPHVNIYDFFDIENSPYVNYRSDGTPFTPTYFSDVIFNWHTFNEINNTLDQKSVCEAIFQLLSPGGELMIEIPDTQVDPYATAIRRYHEQHPEVPFGTVSDTRSDGGDFPPRYFPSRGEILALLQSVGFEISPPEDVNTYLITNYDEEGNRELQLKELVIHATKPRDIDWR